MPGTLPIRKILITNIVSLNPGDAAILWGSIEILRRKYGPDTKVIVFDSMADAARKYYPWATFRQALFARPSTGWLSRNLQRIGYGHWNIRLRFLRFLLAVWLLKRHVSLLARCFATSSELDDLREYVSADLILSTGGTYLIENYNLKSAIANYRLVLATGKPLGFFTQTLGPFKKPHNRRAFANIFSNAAVILLRDERSKAHVLELGVSAKNISLATDAAFVLVQHNIESQPVANKDLIAGQAPRVAISVRSMRFFHPQHIEQYFEGIVQAVKVAVEEFGARVTFLSTCQGIPEYWADDADTADEIYAMLPEQIRQYVKIDRHFRQPVEVVNVYQTFDAVIATRMHAAILSLCAGTPTLGVAYEFKMEELFRNAGMAEFVLSVESLTAGGVRECVRQLLLQRDACGLRIKSAANKMCSEAWKAQAALPDLGSSSAAEIERNVGHSS